MPTFNDLYYTFVGNTQLQPEVADQYNLGITWAHRYDRLIRYFSVQAEGYLNNVTNKIVAVPTTNLYRWMMLNIGAARIKGVDINAESSILLGTDWSVKPGLRYTYQEAIDVSDKDQNYGAQIPYVPRHNGSAVLGAIWKNCSFNYSFIYTGARYGQKANIPENRLQPWYTHDVAAAVSLPFGQWTVKAFAEVNNVFNQFYDVVLNFPMPGRYYRVGISIQY